MPSEAALDTSKLLDFLEVVSEELGREPEPRPVTLVAAGGTAMTLLNLKPSTRDVDFTGPGEDLKRFKRVLQTLPHGLKIDVWPDGQIFSQFLPADYLTRSRRIRRFGRIDLRALHPVDIVVSKMGRLDSKDVQDIEACIRGAGLGRSTIARRAARVQVAGNEENFRYSVEYVLNRYFPPRAKSRRR